MIARFGRPCPDCDAATDQPCDETCLSQMPAQDASTHDHGLPTTSPTWLGERVGLSAHEGAIVSLIVLGLSNQEIAGALYLSAHSVRTHIRSAYLTMGVTSRTQAVSWGVHHGLHLMPPAARLDAGERR